MKLKHLCCCFFLAQLLFGQNISIDQDALVLGQANHLGPSHYRMVTLIEHYSPRGALTKTEEIQLEVLLKPGSPDTILCLKIGLLVDTVWNEYSQLMGWSYQFDGTDREDQVLGVPVAPFEQLRDAEGKDVEINHRYALYNAFIDFHAITHVFGNPSSDGLGIQHLNKVGDTIVHASAFSKPSVALGEAVKQGSYFQNGEVKLYLKGWAKIANEIQALVGFDSGDSNFEMLLEPVSNVNIKAIGYSRYQGELYKNVMTGVVSKAYLNEWVPSQAFMNGDLLQSDIVQRRIFISLLD